MPTTRKRLDALDGGMGKRRETSPGMRGTGSERRLCFGTIFQLIGIVAGFLRRDGMLTKNSKSLIPCSIVLVKVN